jgi:Family of unknown function (DUF5989)
MDGRPSEFEQAAKQQRDRNTIGELWLFLRDNKKWWLLPLLAALVLFGLLMLLAGTGAAPFIYTLF